MVEAALDTVHDQLRALLREVRDLEAVRERALDACMATVGVEAVDLDEERKDDIEFSWLGGAPDFGARLVEDPDETEQALRRFLADGDLPTGLPTTVERFELDTGEIVSWPVREQVRTLGREFHEEVQERAPLLEDLRRRLDESWNQAAALLREWAHSENSDTSDWGRIQQAWRNALGLPGKVAADVLGVSPPAVTRYEKGSRSPSLAYVESMVERIVAHGAEASDATKAVYGLADAFNTTVASALEGLDAASDNELSDRDHLATRIDALPIEDVGLLLKIVRSSAALAALRRIAPDDELEPVREALHEGTRP